ncbi:hypothetical protein F4821DRAFT_262648 [Hypoxylon rubiginosum]|uniref:Uncharacterized protein n=1 Tax=Hypoxylon rubiginosum TaxID=110542 RepID=A0ACC0CTL4_9PEZI|nr:hypothetical protein F4821DRAFT_262648 [Hypoxylon rubiginosum]
MAVATDIQWKIATSAKGKYFPIGFAPDESVADTTVKVTAGLRAAESSFGIAVDWPVSPSITTKWIYTPEEVAEKTAITQYILFGLSFLGRTYIILQFSSMESYHYRFHDEADDSYPCLTDGAGNYSVMYQSNKPRIVYISGNSVSWWLFGYLCTKYFFIN